MTPDKPRTPRTHRTGPTARERPGRRARRPPRRAARCRRAGERPRSRLTGRAAVLVLVLAVLTVSYASSLRAYLEQRAHINDLKTQIAEHEANIDALERRRSAGRTRPTSRSRPANGSAT